jgi:hypothetical protein
MEKHFDEMEIRKEFGIDELWLWCRRSESNRHGVAPAGF